MRVLFLSADEHWRAPFELVQAALAFDLPVELGFAGAGLQLLDLGSSLLPSSSARAFASLRLLGLSQVQTGGSCGPADSLGLPLRWLALPGWSAWLRAGSLQLC